MQPPLTNSNENGDGTKGGKPLCAIPITGDGYLAMPAMASIIIASKVSTSMAPEASSS